MIIYHPFFSRVTTRESRTSTPVLHGSTELAEVGHVFQIADDFLAFFPSRMISQIRRKHHDCKLDTNKNDPTFHPFLYNFSHFFPWHKPWETHRGRTGLVEARWSRESCWNTSAPRCEEVWGTKHGRGWFITPWVKTKKHRGKKTFESKSDQLTCLLFFFFRTSMDDNRPINGQTWPPYQCVGPS